MTISSYVLAAGSNLLFVGVVNTFDSGSTTSGVTYNGVALTQIGSKLITSAGDDTSITIWYGIEAVIGSGTHDIVATRSAASTSPMRMIAASYLGVAQTGTIINPTSPASQAVHSGTWTNSVTTTVNNSWVLSFCENENTGSNLVAGTGANAVTSTLYSMIFDSLGSVATAGSYSMTVTTAGTPFWGGFSVGIAPSTALPIIEAFANTSTASPVVRISSPQTLSYTFSPVGSNPILFVTWRDCANDATITTATATWNGTSMTAIASNNGRTAGFYLINPVDTGTHNVVVSWDVTTARAITSAVTITNAAQSSPIDANAIAAVSSTAISVSASTSTANTLLIDYFGADGDADTVLTVNASQAVLFQNSLDSNGVYGGSSYKNAITTGSKTMSWSKTGGTNLASGYSGFAAIKVATAAGPTGVKAWDAVTQSTGIKTYEGVALASTKSVTGIS